MPARQYRGGVTLLLITHERCLEHVAGPSHPERPARLQAAWHGIESLDLGSDLETVEATPAPDEALLRVHDPALVERLAQLDAAGGGRLDPDTGMSPASWEAARLAAGAGLDAIDRLDAGEASGAFCAVRPPGHHATPRRSMGFCLLNNVAVAATALADRGERVLIVDYDAHHGNGTQDVFYEDPRVLFVSFHQWPLYPGTGALDETGRSGGLGTTINLPLPPGATGEHYRRAWDDVVAARVEHFDPTWVIVSAGFDGHRQDPITELGLSSGDLADVTLDVLAVVPAGRRLVFLEGGYDLDAISWSTASVVAAMAGERHHPERPTSGGPGGDAVAAAVALHTRDVEEIAADQVGD